jgi:hypothetical protein
MRRESSTVVALVGDVGAGLLAVIARSPNVSVARAAASGGADGAGDPAARPGWQAGALALREAARRKSTYVIVADDPLAGVAAAWRAMWEVPAGPAGAADFEERAADALAAWQDRRFELPDYYLMVASEPAGVTGADLYLGPLRAARPRRVAVAGGPPWPAPLTASTTATGPAPTGPAAAGARAAVLAAPGLLDTLRSLEHGPWWPPLGELLDAARRFYPGGLSESRAGWVASAGPGGEAGQFS